MQFSIIICTYNPDKDRLIRVVNNCLLQDWPQNDFEIILVDNNSQIPVSDLFKTSTVQNLKLVRENNPGLVYARIAGYNASHGKTIVFVDDDNIIALDYLKTAAVLLNKYKNVALWGPGVINLEYPDGVPSWIDKFFSSLYQKKNFTSIRTGCMIEWQEYYPSGSGMIVKREVFEKYLNLFRQGAITATGRKGESLASAEDSQLVWTGIIMGFNAGTAPELQLIHIIPGKRTNLAYLRKLNYWISYSYYTALKEMFPDYKVPYKARSLSGKLKFTMKILLNSGFHPALFYRMYTIKNAWPAAYEDFLRASKDDKLLS